MKKRYIKHQHKSYCLIIFLIGMTCILFIPIEASSQTIYCQTFDVSLILSKKNKPYSQCIWQLSVINATQYPYEIQHDSTYLKVSHNKNSSLKIHDEFDYSNPESIERIKYTVQEYSNSITKKYIEYYQQSKNRFIPKRQVFEFSVHESIKYKIHYNTTKLSYKDKKLQRIEFYQNIPFSHTQSLAGEISYKTDKSIFSYRVIQFEKEYQAESKIKKVFSSVGDQHLIQFYNNQEQLNILLNISKKDNQFRLSFYYYESSLLESYLVCREDYFFSFKNHFNSLKQIQQYIRIYQNQKQKILKLHKQQHNIRKQINELAKQTLKMNRVLYFKKKNRDNPFSVIFLDDPIFNQAQFNIQRIEQYKKDKLLKTILYDTKGIPIKIEHYNSFGKNVN